MKVGYLYEKKEEEVKKDVEKGVSVSLGVEVSSLLDTINVHEVNAPGRADIVLSMVKKECLFILRKIEEQEVKENDKEN